MFLLFQVSISEEHLPENQRTINLVLRMRNTKRELNDIRFEFQPTKVSILYSFLSGFVRCLFRLYLYRYHKISVLDPSNFVTDPNPWTCC
jgi:hypothetical protein